MKPWEAKNNNKKERFLSEETLKSKKSHLVEIKSQSFTRQTQFPYKMTLYNSFTI